MCAVNSYFSREDFVMRKLGQQVRKTNHRHAMDFWLCCSVGLFVLAVAHSWGGEWGYAGPLTETDEAGNVFFRGVKAGETVRHRFEWLGKENKAALDGASVVFSCDCLSLEGIGTGKKKGDGWADVAWRPTTPGQADYDVFFEKGGEIVKRLVFHGEAEDGWWERDWDVYVENEAEDKLLENPRGAIWVDLRGEEAFLQGHVPGATPMSATEAEGAPFLRKGHVVLMDAGGQPQEVERVCQMMRKRGAEDVKVWYGGMNAWVRRGGAVEGNGPYRQNRLTMREAQRVEFYGDWMAVSLGGAGPELGPGTGWVNGWCDGEELKGLLDEVTRKAEIIRGRETLCLLLMTEDGRGYAGVEAMLKDYPAYVYYLEGGRKVWEEWQRMLATTATGGDVLVVTSSSAGSGGCGPCAEKRAKMAHGGQK